jgi:cytochrome P450 family 110
MSTVVDPPSPRTQDAVPAPEPARTALPPGPAMSSLVQTWRYARKPLPLLDECARQFGDIFTLRLLGTHTWVFLCSPPLIKTLFSIPPALAHGGAANASVFGPITGTSTVFTIDGEAHLARRRLLLPQFHGDRMQVYFTQVRDIATEAVNRWPRGQFFSIHAETQRITLTTIVRAVFGIEDDREDAESTKLIEALTRLANDAVGSSLLLARGLQIDLGRWSPWGRLMAIVRRADAALLGEINRRRVAPPDPNRQDILSLLLQVRQEDGSPLSDRQLRDELVTMLMAGHETSGTALAWAFERVLSSPQVEERLRAELERVVGNDPFSAAHLSRLEYLDATVKESLRIRPIMPAGGGRVLQKPLEVGGYVIPAGVLLINGVYLLHRRPDLYPDPETFNPDRFLGKRIDPYEWTPFGGGVRRCLGMAFALFEMKVVIATVLLRTRLRIERPNVPVARRGFFLAPAGGPRVMVR